MIACYAASPRQETISVVLKGHNATVLEISCASRTWLPGRNDRSERALKVCYLAADNKTVITLVSA
jgi:hypothetical protein